MMLNVQSKKTDLGRNGFFGQGWPFLYLSIKSQQTISGNLIVILINTLMISYIFYTLKVKILLKDYNPQVTKVFNIQVGTSETIRLLSNKRFLHKSHNIDLKFKEWLAGLIDGDGCFHLSKKGYANLEITMDIRDERALSQIKINMVDL